jgi:hypothetical protein
MKVPHDEEVANRISPESCGGYGNIAAEALTGENAGGLLSSEITAFRVPTLWLEGEGNIFHSAIRELCKDPAESKNLACVEAFCARIERLVNFPVSKNWNGGNQCEKSPGVPGCALPRHKQRTRIQGANIGRGGEGSIPYVHLIMFHESRTTTYYLRSRRTMGTLCTSPRRCLWREGR